MSSGRLSTHFCCFITAIEPASGAAAQVNPQWFPPGSDHFARSAAHTLAEGENSGSPPGKDAGQVVGALPSSTACFASSSETPISSAYCAMRCVTGDAQ